MTAEGRKPAGAPRWVKVSLLAAVVLVAVIAVLLLVGGHGPGRHALLP